MGFVLKSVFWLGLVYSAMPLGELSTAEISAAACDAISRPIAEPFKSFETTYRSAALAGCIAELRGSASPATTHEVAKPQFVSADNPRASRHSLTDSDLRAPWSGAAVPPKRKRS